MNGLIKIKSDETGILTVSSRDVAAHFEKEHKNVLQVIDGLKTSAEKSANLFIESFYYDSYNREQKEYQLTRDGFCLVVMGFTGQKALEWKLKYIEAFNEMESAWNSPEKVMARALLMAERTINRLQETVQAQEPAVAFAKAVSAASNSILVGDMAKLLKQNGLNIGRDRLFEKLREQGYLCTTGLSYNKPTQYSMDLKIMEYSTNAIARSNGSVFTKFTPKITGKGQQYFIKHFLKSEAN